MRQFWKQRLWIGGIVWCVIWLLLMWQNFALAVAASLLALGLLVSLVAVPAGVLERAGGVMRRTPVLSTLLVSVGWAPYVSGAVFVISAAAAFVLQATGSGHLIGSLMKGIMLVERLQECAVVFTALMAVFAIVIRKQSVMGCLDNRFKLTDDGSCTARVVEPAVAAAAKKAYKCRKK